MPDLPKRSALWLILLAALSADASAQGDRTVDDEALVPLAQSLSSYLEARDSGTDIEGATSELARQVESLGVMLKDRAPLRHVADLGRAAWLSRAYEDVKLRPGKLRTDELSEGAFANEGIEIAYWIPKDYDPSESDYPLLLALPDEGEGAAEHLRTHWTLRELKDEAILVSPAMPADLGEWDRVMVDGRPGGLCHVLGALRFAAERFALDFDRVFVAGRGKSVPAALAAGNYSPQGFAGVIGRAGDVGEIGPENFGNLPTYLTGGGARATAFHATAAAAGIENCTLDPTGKEKDIWRWLSEQRRGATPTSVTIVPGDPFPTRAYWLRVAPNAPDARATATIDTELNTVRIESNGVARATLYLNDALVDLDRPLTVVCNGEPLETRVRRHLATTLDLLVDGTSDPACVYVAEAIYDMDGAEGATLSAGAGYDPEWRDRLAAAASSADELWKLHEWCLAEQREAEALATLRRIVRVAPDDERARAALEHRASPVGWFTSDAELARFERSQDRQAAEAKGHIEYKSIWMHPAERALYTKGLRKDHQTGQWLTKAERERLAGGWIRQDLEWISPEFMQLVDTGQWRVGGDWFDLAGANRRHSQIDTMWRIPSAEVLVYSTADREVALRAQAHMQLAVANLRRVFGAEPTLPLDVAVLRDEEQYDRFAFGAPDGRRRATHAGRLHVVHSAFFAESWFPRVEGKHEYRGMGVCYWDPLVPYGDLYGVHSARLALGLSYVEALDPSPKAVRKALADGPGPDYYSAFQAEKKLPAWLRYGGAVYAERFFRDTTVATDADPWWARAWSIDNLEKLGSLRPLVEVLDGQLDPDDPESSRRLLIEQGLVVAFVVDGGCAPVDEAHAELKRALAAGRLHAKHVDALRAALVASEDALRAFPAE